jgi:hypothetical protein
LNASSISSIANLSTYFEGEVNLAMVYNYLLPLSDGGIGGWSTSPLINPMSTFSSSGQGIIYGIQVQCESASTATSSFSATKIYLASSSVNGSTLSGTFKIYLPAGSVRSTLDMGHGVDQVCNFSVRLGAGIIEYQYTSDEWNMVAISTIESIQIPGAPRLVQRQTSQYSYTKIAPFLMSALCVLNTNLNR